MLKRESDELVVREDILTGRPIGRATGYASPLYPRSLAEFGEPVKLRSSGGWILKRSIRDTPLHDATGCYPYLVCRSWNALVSDLNALQGSLVSFCCVADPFGDFDREQLAAAFDQVIEFKTHYVADLSKPIDEIVSPHHLRGGEKALKKIQVEFYEDPVPLLDLWMDLYSHHLRRFRLTGLRAFSRESLRRQLEIPGAVVSVARLDGKPIAAHMWMIHGGVCHAHLACGLPESNKLGASYALYLSEIARYRGRAKFIDWGGDAGALRQGSLSSFKQGWANARRPSYFCTRVLDPTSYDRLSTGKPTTYFPAYREGELV
jgi:hypothetical protein